MTATAINVEGGIPGIGVVVVLLLTLVSTEIEVTAAIHEVDELRLFIPVIIEDEIGMSVLLVAVNLDKINTNYH